VFPNVVFSIIKLFPPAKKHSQVVEIMRSVQDLTRPQPGCSGCWLSDDDSLDNHICYAEQWDSEEAMHAHIRSGVYRRVLAAMEISKQPPEVRFCYVKEEKGLELIEELRCLETNPSQVPHVRLN
jgi:quinol monooxygenase YgiN